MSTLTPNRYATQCGVYGCGKEIGAGEGFYRTKADGRRAFYCAAHKPAYDTSRMRWSDEMYDTRMYWSDEMQATASDYDDEQLTPETKDEPHMPVNIDAATLDAAVAKVAELTAQHFLTHVPPLVKDTMVGLTRVVEIKVGNSPKVKVDRAHKSLPTILQALCAGASPFLVGPAGSGKTTMAEQIAATLKLKFYMAARVTSEFKLVGFIDATGKCVRTQFRDAYEKGGVFLFDEVDASDPDAMTAFNAALANGYADFPDSMVKRHPHFHAVAAGNTFGRGADHQYVGRNQLDAATLDRFQVFEVDYDEDLETELAGNTKWSNYVQSVRKAVDREKVRHIVSPRASIIGAKMLAAGMEWGVVENATIWKGLPAVQRSRVEYARVN